MAENMSGHGIAKMGMPMFDVGIGKQFSKIWSTRLTLGYRRQKGWASDEANPYFIARNTFTLLSFRSNGQNLGAKQ